MPARSAELTIGRTFGVTLDHGDDFFPSLSDFCDEHGIRYGYIPLFLGAFSEAKIVGTCQKYDPHAPMLSESVDVEFVETFGIGTLAYDEEQKKVLPHVHFSVGKRLHGAVAATSHLFEARVQFLVEMVVVEVVAPKWTRPTDTDLFNLKLLRFG